MSNTWASAGRLLELVKGAYDATTEYHMLDLVFYNGSTYIAKDTTLGNVPTNTTYWQIFAQGTASAVAGSYYGTCASAANVQNKVVSVSNDQNFTLQKGVILGVKFTYTNTFSASDLNHITLNVNSEGAYPIYFGDTEDSTGTNPVAFGKADFIHYYLYDGVHWIYIANSGVQTAEETPFSAPGFTATNTKDAIIEAAENGGLLPHVVVSVETDSTVTLTKGGTTITATETSSGVYEADVDSYGSWTITATKSGVTATDTLTVDTVKVYNVTIAYFTATITVTYPAGSTCTCIGNGETQTATNNPETFTVYAAGTYTLTATDGTSTTSETVTITTSGQSESVTLSYIPDGKTVTPTDDIQTWLACAGITDKFYTTLTEVLEDETTLAALMSNNNAVDYLKRSTTWVSDTDRGATLVPAMTSNTTPSGEVSASSELSNRPAWHAFDGAADAWQPTSNQFANSWVQYKFVSAVCVKSVMITDYYGGISGSEHQIKNFKILASNDNFSTQVELYSGIHEQNVKTFYADFDSNNNSYQYYRLLIVDNYGGTAVGVNEIELYARTEEIGITGNALAMHDIGISNYATDTLRGDSTWLQAIGGSTHIDNVLNTKAPIMTSNSVPSGNCFAKQSAYNNYDPWMAFDGTSGKYYQENTNVAIGDTLGYKFSSPVAIQKVYCLSNNAFKEYKVQGSNDGTTWTDVKTGIDHTSHESSAVFSNTTAYEYWQIAVTQVDASGSKMAILKLQFWGREDVPSTITKKTFATATDAEINEMCKWSERGVIDLEDDCGWAVGQEHTFTLGAIASTGTFNGITWNVANAQPQQSVTLALTRKGGAERVSPVLNTDGTSRNTFAFEYDWKDCLSAKEAMNSTNTNTGSWGATLIRAFCNSGLLQQMLAVLPMLCNLFKVITAKTYNGTENETTNDYFAPRAEKEIFGSATYSNTTEAGALTQATYYETSANRIKKVNSSADNYWERSPQTAYATTICHVGFNGNANANGASNTYGIAPFGGLG